MGVTGDIDSFRSIGREELILHALLDMYEFSAHAFGSIDGPYFWDGLGLDFMTSTPVDRVLEHAKNVGADTLYMAHTHPLSNDDSIRFLGATIDPREEIAYGYKPLPVGNGPSSGDAKLLAKLKTQFLKSHIDVVGVVFAASGVWEFDILDLQKFNADSFEAAHNAFHLSSDEDTFNAKELRASADFPNYFMELEKPKLHELNTSTYTLQLKERTASPTTTMADSDNIARTIKLFADHNVSLTFHSYADRKIDPLELMRHSLSDWSKLFAQ
ncbi:MAG TPA: hypothetical protein VN031_03885 [Candidatus Microsaccharimonas sp.]|nr:hypothetical protein [Candidatus Microsaccharimonas sp.]